MADGIADDSPARAQIQARLPRVAITYCTQCRWMLRAAYFGQELLSTFSTSIGEIALIPATGGIFQVKLTYIDTQGDTSADTTISEVLLWDRKTEGGFPETKVLKQLLRNHIEPDRDLGHSDKPGHGSKAVGSAASARKSAHDGTPSEPGSLSGRKDVATPVPTSEAANECKDCEPVK